MTAKLFFICPVVRTVAKSELHSFSLEGLDEDLTVSTERLRDSETFYFASDTLIVFVRSHFHQFNESQLCDISLSPFM
jgi:hypothetical protein